MNITKLFELTPEQVFLIRSALEQELRTYEKLAKQSKTIPYQDGSQQLAEKYRKLLEVITL